MTTILEFWENIYGGATTIAKAPDPIMNIPKIKFEAPTWYGAKSTSTVTPKSTSTVTPKSTSSGNNPANSTRDHTHTNGNGNGIPWYVMIVGVLAGALIIYMLLKKGIFG